MSLEQLDSFGELNQNPQIKPNVRKPEDLSDTEILLEDGQTLSVAFKRAPETPQDLFEKTPVSPIKKVMASGTNFRIGLAYNQKTNLWFIQWHDGQADINRALLNFVNEDPVLDLAIPVQEEVEGTLDKAA